MMKFMNFLRSINILKETDYNIGKLKYLKEKQYIDENHKIEREAPLSRQEIIESPDYSAFQIADYEDNGKPIFIIVDDLKLTKKIYENEFTNIKTKYGKDILSDFNVIWSLGPDAGYKAINFIKNNKVEYAILDITLGNPIKLENGDYLEIDGLDISYFILKSNPDSKFIFSTAHTFNANSSIATNFKNKMMELTGIDIIEKRHYVSYKNSRQTQDIYNLLYGDQRVL